MDKALRLIIGVILTLLLTGVFGLAINPPKRAPVVMAQILPAPSPLPSPPPVPAPSPTVGAMPRLAPAPTVPMALASPTPTLRIFQCSCFGPASYTRWMGQVQASSYFDANRAAVSACIANNTNKSPNSAFIQPQVTAINPALTMPPGFAPANPQAGVRAPSGLLIAPNSELPSLCSKCACD